MPINTGIRIGERKFNVLPHTDDVVFLELLRATQRDDESVSLLTQKKKEMVLYVNSDKMQFLLPSRSAVSQNYMRMGHNVLKRADGFK